jgi:hypothetical protein
MLRRLEMNVPERSTFELTSRPAATAGCAMCWSSRVIMSRSERIPQNILMVLAACPSSRRPTGVIRFRTGVCIGCPPVFSEPTISSSRLALDNARRARSEPRMGYHYVTTPPPPRKSSVSSTYEYPAIPRRAVLVLTAVKYFLK